MTADDFKSITKISAAVWGPLFENNLICFEPSDRWPLSPERNGGPGHKRSGSRGSPKDHEGLKTRSVKSPPQVTGVPPQGAGVTQNYVSTQSWFWIARSSNVTSES